LKTGCVLRAVILAIGFGKEIEYRPNRNYTGYSMLVNKLRRLAGVSSKIVNDQRRERSRAADAHLQGRSSHRYFLFLPGLERYPAGSSAFA